MPKMHYKENFIFSKKTFDSEQESIHVHAYFDSLWLGGFEALWQEMPYALYSLVIRGKAISSDASGKTSVSREGDFLAFVKMQGGGKTKVPPGECWTRKCIEIRRNTLHDALSECFFTRNGEKVSLRSPEKVEAIFDAIRSEMEADAPDDSTLSGLFLRLLCEVRSQSRSERMPEALALALDYIQTNFTRHDIIREDIASAAGVSVRTLNRLFLEYGKSTPLNCVAELRLAYAGRLLSRTLVSMKEVANACGFGSANFLARRFRVRYGETPREYRRRHGRRALV